MITSDRVRAWLLAAAVILSTAALATAQESDPAPSEDVPAGPNVPEDVLGRGTPRGSVSGFFAAAENGDFERASKYLDLRFLPWEHRDVPPDELAMGLTVVLQRALQIDVSALSVRPEGLSGDGLPDYRDELGRIKRNEREVVLLLERVPREDGELVWKISSGTVAQAVDLYDEFGYGPFVTAIADAMPEVSFLGIELFKWVIGIGFLLLSYPVLVLLGWLLARIVSSPRSEFHPRVRRFFIGPVALLTAIMIGSMVIFELGVGPTGQRIARARTLPTIVTVWLIFSFASLVSQLVAYKLREKGREAAVVLLRPITTAVKTAVLLGAVLIWLDNVGYDITTLLAGLGIGGLAVALALQKPLEDLFGALTLFTQQIVRVNDFCRFGTRMGTVEEIGLRTTRVRTLDDTVVSLPNAKFASEYIENITARKKIRYRTFIRLRHETTTEQLKEVLEKARLLVAEHAEVVPDSSRVRFKELGEYAHLLEVNGYISTTNYAEFLRVAEEINLGIVDIVGSAGAQFALPMERPSG